MQSLPLHVGSRGTWIIADERIKDKETCVIQGKSKLFNRAPCHSRQSDNSILMGSYVDETIVTCWITVIPAQAGIQWKQNPYNKESCLTGFPLAREWRVMEPSM